MINEPSTRQETQAGGAPRWAIYLLLVLVLAAGATYRLAGLFWGEYQYLHPDERFLIWVGNDITPLKCQDPALPVDLCPPDQRTWMSLGDYFDTLNSTLNPNNRGHGFYVYGTLPMFLTRFMVEWIFGQSDWVAMLKVGRGLSALFDLLTVFLVFLTARRLYGHRVALLAAAFSAATVLQIQQSHFFTMDTFLLFFILLAFYFAVRVLTDRRDWEAGPYTPTSLLTHPLLLPSLGFGIALGMGVASKLNAAPVAVVLPAAMLLRLAELPAANFRRHVRQFLYALGFLALAALVSLLVFRVLQPYAFSGPGFFDVKLNPAWWANIQELRAQSSGDVDFPPAMQWARRSVFFSGQNLTLWGLGLPLGLLAWAGFLWAGWRFLARRAGPAEWPRHALIWGWTALYFTWQSLALNPTMRYQLPVYPMLAILAGWAVVALWDAGRARAVAQAMEAESAAEPAQADGWPDVRPGSGGVGWQRVLAVLAGASVLLATHAYAYAFTGVYTRPMTRVAAARWIYQNIPGPINLRIQAEEGLYNQPVPFPYQSLITAYAPFDTSFQPNASGSLSEIFLANVQDESGGAADELTLTISALPGGEQPLASARQSLRQVSASDENSTGVVFTLDRPVTLIEEQTYYLRVALPGNPGGAALDGQLNLRYQVNEDEIANQALPARVQLVEPTQPYVTSFIPPVDAALTRISLSEVLAGGVALPERVEISLSSPAAGMELLHTDLAPQANLQGDEILVELDWPIPLYSDEEYLLTLTMIPPGGAVRLAGDGIANEGDWDDALPLRLDNYDGFGGIYPLDLNFNMYWDDNPDKLARFQRILDEAEWLVITSSRQWGSLPRLPERFPMTTVYYRNLLGCPPEREIAWCYSMAKPGMFSGNLGYELVEVFQSDPQIGPLRINTQFAEEAFTVYDHPKVLIFRKTDAYDPAQVAALLGAVDFSKVVRVPPMRAGRLPADLDPPSLLLPAERLAEQQSGGTWSELFDTAALHNRFPLLGALVWYLSLFLLGLVAFPLVRRALPGLADGGYPLARTAGLLLFSYLVWVGGSLRIPVNRLTITAAFLVLALGGGLLAYRQRDELGHIWRSQRRYLLVIEGLFLTFFVFDLLIRLGNPDLWHPYKGGEKPMDFAYFNAILKSTTFPPYDPWYAGGYLNYYYYGFVLVGVLTKWLGIVPAVAYNLILPTIFSLIGLGAFSVAWNLYTASRGTASPAAFGPAHPDRPDPELDGNGGADESPATFSMTNYGLNWGGRADPDPAGPEPVDPEPAQPGPTALLDPRYLVGLSGALGMAVLGNLGTVRMIYQGYQRLAAPGGAIEGAGFFTRLQWAVQGLGMAIKGSPLPYGAGDWYWIPSRAIPPQGDVEPITEFPFFTVLYGDPHAHLFAMPIALLALAFALSLVLSRARWRGPLAAGLGFLLGGLSIGALRPTNTWDLPTYLALGVVALGYALLTYFCLPERLVRRLPALGRLSLANQRWLAAAGGVLLLAGLAFVLYQPYSQWYSLGYTQVGLWEGSRTPLSAYFTHWGLFLFVIVSWMAWESYDWMARTPLSALAKLAPYQGLIIAGLLTPLALTLGLVWWGVPVAWLAVPLATWAALLLLRPGQPDAKRFVLFLIGTGLVLTLAVEVIVLRGDIGRMNTVFKFYLQVWTLFAVSAAAGLGWLLLAQPRWLPGLRRAWLAGLALLVAGAALYPYMAGIAKVQDRMVPGAPHTLDGMAYMEHATYNWLGEMDLSQDYRAIRWMQENVKGSPVIVEANLRELYRWGSRFSIYTGLPNPAGWEWHQQQQRAVLPAMQVTDRILETQDFYTTLDLGAARAFLEKYVVRYIIVGQLEYNVYPGEGLEKFAAADGSLWRAVYRDGATTIYEVMP